MARRCTGSLRSGCKLRCARKRGECAACSLCCCRSLKVICFIYTFRYVGCLRQPGCRRTLYHPGRSRRDGICETNHCRASGQSPGRKLISRTDMKTAIPLLMTGESNRYRYPPTSSLLFPLTQPEKQTLRFPHRVVSQSEIPLPWFPCSD